MFSEKDLSQIANKGLTESLVLEQISHFKQGFPSSKIINAATVDDGIIALNDDNLSELVNYYEKKLGQSSKSEICFCFWCRITHV
jgi:hypothetical protein